MCDDSWGSLEELSQPEDNTYFVFTLLYKLVLFYFYSDYHYSSDRFDLSDYSTGYMSGQSVPVSGCLRPQGIFAQHGNHSHTYTGSRSYFLSRYLPAVECTKCTLLLICLYLVLSKRLCISENGCTCDRNGKSA